MHFLSIYSKSTGNKYALAEINRLLLLFSLSLEKVKLPAVSVSLTNQPSYDILQEQPNAEIYVQELTLNNKKYLKLFY